MRFSVKLVPRSKEVMKGQKLRKKVKADRISNFIKSKHIVRQDEALDVKISKKVVLR